MYLGQGKFQAAIEAFGQSAKANDSACYQLRMLVAFAELQARLSRRAASRAARGALPQPPGGDSAGSTSAIGSQPGRRGRLQLEVDAHGQPTAASSSASAAAAAASAASSTSLAASSSSASSSASAAAAASTSLAASSASPTEADAADDNDAIERLGSLLCEAIASLQVTLPDAVPGSVWSQRSDCRNATRGWGAAFTPAAAARFGARKYASIKPVLPAHIRKFARPWYRYLAGRPREAEQVLAGYSVRWLEKRGRWELLQEPFAEMLTIMLASLASRATGLPLVPSYAFPIVYPPGGGVEWHIDQKDNEISLSFQVEMVPSKATWPLFFVDYNFTASPGVAPPSSISLNEWDLEHAATLRTVDNQGVIYRGQELVHYRPPLPEGHQLTQIVLAWRVPNELSCNG